MVVTTEMNLEECYRTLDVKPGASLQEARRSYYKLLKFFHPDRHQGSPGLLRKATEETKKLNLAYEHLCRVLRGTKGSMRTSSEQRRDGPRARAKTSSHAATPTQGHPFTVPSLGMKLSWIAPGRFLMGSAENEAGRSNDEGPQTEVTISRGFWMGIFPVTQEEWKVVLEEGSGEGGLKIEPSFFRGTRLPVEQVSWNECQTWLGELNAIEEGTLRELRGDYAYRLPTEAEWEFACRAGTKTRFYGGDAEGCLGEYAWYAANAGGQLKSVGEKKANGCGLHDMHGNVWEWCRDWYGPLKGGKCSDPAGPALGMKRVMRGGSWGVAAARCRSAYRVWNEAGYRDYTVGFRVVLGSRF